jgi:M6 family metalloprotease-like protein
VPNELDVFKWLADYKGVPAPTDRTLRNYYKEVSYDQYQINVEVVNWVTLSHPYEYYLGQDQGYFANENGDARMGDLVLEAVKLADATVDFSQYAVDGEVPGIFIIHRGTGAEYNLDPEIIWSHKWDRVIERIGPDEDQRPDRRGRCARRGAPDDQRVAHPPLDAHGQLRTGGP